MLSKSNDGYLEVLPSQVEGELCLKKVKPLKRSQIKLVFYFLGCIFTGGILYVITKIWPRIYEKIVFVNVKNSYDATHVHVIDVNEEDFYEKMEVKFSS